MNPPTTRNTVMPTSLMKPNSRNRFTPVRSVYSGSFRNMASIAPPKVAAAQTTKNRRKKLAPSRSRARCETGFSGSKYYWKRRSTISAALGSFSITRLDLSTRTAKSMNGLCSFA